MDIDLKSLGEVAGIGGIALGLVVLLVRPLISVIRGVPRQERSGLVRLIAAGCFGIGVLGIFAWVFASRPAGPAVTTQGAQSPAIMSEGNATVTYGNGPAAPAPAPAQPPP